MTHPAVSEELVRRAVLAKGQVRDHGGIGASMRAALEAIADDLITAGTPDPRPSTP